MNRAQRRQQARMDKKRQATYNLTAGQLHDAVHSSAEREFAKIEDEVRTEAINQALILLLTLPLEVLMDHYWQKSYAKKIPEFTEYVLEYYTKWQNGELDMDKLKQDLWEYGGVRLEQSE